MSAALPGSNAPRLNSVAIIAVTSTGEPSRMARVSRLRTRTSTLRRVSSHHCRTMPVRLTSERVAGMGRRAEPAPCFGSPAAARESLRPDLRGVLTQRAARIPRRDLVHAEVAPSLGRAAGEGQVAVASQEYHPVTPVDAGRLVRREDDGDSALAESAQQPHHVGRGRRIEPGGGFVEEEKAWPGQ